MPTSGNLSGRSGHQRPRVAPVWSVPRAAIPVPPVRECINNSLLAIEIGDGNPSRCCNSAQTSGGRSHRESFRFSDSSSPTEWTSFYGS